ncbi:MAG: hypothetical protein WBO16_17825 [Gammaproteobacteria bacterium]
MRSDRLKRGDEIITTQLPLAVNGLKVDVRNETTLNTEITQQLPGERP